MEQLIFRKQFGTPSREAETVSYTHIFSFAFITIIRTQQSLEVRWSFFFLPV
ncbi:hypothetical protein [Prolixibacter bellariivorans]|uniref:hypothetical protein n=1 Tax=Prolixibacter bellariivorans TaxID=314319 RepID=UPI001298F15A|nr:hypothetical protein [Prolixibacter bellariivorans]